MAIFDLPKTKFELHPAGTFEGRIIAVEDKGEMETQYGPKHKLAILIESTTEFKQDGQPFTAAQWLTVSSSTKSNLYKTRRSLLGRELTPDECHRFDEEELVGKIVGYQIVHNEGAEGSVFANVDNLWPIAGRREEAPSERLVF